jgi:ketosteroid isomerase-like protein
VEGKPIDQVRAIWTAYQRGGVDALREVVGDAPVEWVPLGEEEPLSPEQFWGEWGRRRTEHVSIAVHSFEEHGPCVVAHGSMRTFSEGGFSDVQPSWVYCFRDGVLVQARAYPTREAALEAITRWQAA